MCESASVLRGRMHQTDSQDTGSARISPHHLLLGVMLRWLHPSRAAQSTGSHTDGLNTLAQLLHQTVGQAAVQP